MTPVSKEDPKHGRWILPLVVLALVLFTWTFVNALPPAETVVTNTTAAAGGTTTTTTEPPPETTTTTLAPEVVAFIASADSLSASATELRATADTINSEYDSEVTGYGATRDALSQLRATTSEFNESVAAVAAPGGAAERWADVTTAAAAMSRAADDMLDGLVNTAGSEKRLGALEDYNIAAATFTQAVDAAKTAASGS